MTLRTNQGHHVVQRDNKILTFDNQSRPYQPSFFFTNLASPVTRNVGIFVFSSTKYELVSLYIGGRASKDAGCNGCGRVEITVWVLCPDAVWLLFRSFVSAASGLLLAEQTYASVVS